MNHQPRIPEMVKRGQSSGRAGSFPSPKVDRNTNTETGNDSAGQLYNLADDLGETKNLASEHPERVNEMSALLQRLRDQGRSRP